MKTEESLTSSIEFKTKKNCKKKCTFSFTLRKVYDIIDS